MKEQKRRECNIIIHGVIENINDRNTSLYKQDDNFVTELISTLGVEITSKQVTRLGKENPDSTRPLKVVLNSCEEKDLIMSNLVKLRNASDKSRTISIRDDHIIEQRKLIKNTQKKPTEKTQMKI